METSQKRQKKVPTLTYPTFFFASSITLLLCIKEKKFLIVMFLFFSWTVYISNFRNLCENVPEKRHENFCRYIFLILLLFWYHFFHLTLKLKIKPFCIIIHLIILKCICFSFKDSSPIPIITAVWNNITESSVKKFALCWWMWAKA